MMYSACNTNEHPFVRATLASSSTLTTISTAVICLLALLASPTDGYCQESDDRAYLGVVLSPEVLSPVLQKQLAIAPGVGVIVDRVISASPAERAGIQQFDIIVSADGDDVASANQFVRLVQSKTPGASLALAVIRHGQTRLVDVVLGSSPRASNVESPTPPPEGLATIPGLRDLLSVGPRLPLPPYKDRFRYSERFTTMGESAEATDWTVRIDGDPHSGDAVVNVEKDGVEFSSRIDQLSSLPEDVRAVAEDVVERARLQNKASPPGSGTSQPDPWLRYFDDWM